MKKYLIVLFVSFTVKGIAQNVFPTTGNVGVGIASPSYNLHIYGDNPSLNIENFASAYGAGNSLIFGHSQSGSSIPVAKIYSYLTNGSGASRAGHLIFQTANKGALADRMIITDNGYVGIGTTTPAFPLDVTGLVALGGANLDPASGVSLSALQNSGKCLIGWNRTGGSGEIDFISERGGGGVGGFNFYDYSNTGTLAHLMALTGAGNVGIGTTSPGSKLHVTSGGISESNVVIKVGGISETPNSYTGLLLGGAGNADYRFKGGIVFVPDGTSYGNGSLRFLVNNTPGEGNASLTDAQMCISSSGNVGIGIGTSSPTEKLSVNGNIRSKKITVTQQNWPDYVFDSSYTLAPLSRVEQFIKDNKHLPDVPSAKEVADKGLDLGDNQAVLLKKIEELTLYMIEMKKENRRMNKKIEDQQKEIQVLKNNQHK
ncbi:hypothetical protein ACI6Q2_10615 [Chitinophagaceae bacterium LWZ2-11]